MKESNRGQFAIVLSVMLHIVLLTALGRLLPFGENTPMPMLEFELISTVQAAEHTAPALEPPAPLKPKQPLAPDKKPVEAVNKVRTKNIAANTSNASINNNDVSLGTAAQSPAPDSSSGNGSNSGGDGNNPGGTNTAPGPSKSLKPPQLLNKVEPVYPEAARRQNLEGKVVIRLEVTPNGSVAQATVEQSSGHQSLDNAALAAVKKWRFVPARDANDAPIRSITAVPVVFRIN